MAASGSKSMPKMQDKEKIEDPPQDQPKWWRSGAVNLSGPTFPFALAFMATLVLALILAFVAPFEGRIFTFLGYNGEKRGIRSWGGGNPFGAFGWALACAHIDLQRRFAFHWSMLWDSKYGTRRKSREGRSHCSR